MRLRKRKKEKNEATCDKNLTEKDDNDESIACNTESTQVQEESNEAMEKELKRAKRWKKSKVEESKDQEKKGEEKSRKRRSKEKRSTCVSCKR